VDWSGRKRKIKNKKGKEKIVIDMMGTTKR